MIASAYPISHTQAEHLRACPYRWHLLYQQSARPTPTAVMEEGRIVHDAIRRYHEYLRAQRVECDPSVVTELTRAAFFREPHGLPLERLPELTEVVLAYADSHVVEPKRVVAVEWELLAPLGDGLPPYRGILDLVEQDGDGWTITDHKSKRYIYAQDMRPSESHQLQCYAWLLAELYDLPQVGVRFDFVRLRQRSPREVVTRGVAQEAAEDLRSLCRMVQERLAQVAEGAPVDTAFPRCPGTACVGCTVREACGVRDHLPAGGDPAAVARRLLVAEALAAEDKATLRAYVEAEGPLQVDGYEWAVRQSPTERVDMEAFVRQCAAAGLEVPAYALALDKQKTRTRKFRERYGAILADCTTLVPGRAAFSGKPVREPIMEEGGNGNGSDDE